MNEILKLNKNLKLKNFETKFLEKTNKKPISLAKLIPDSETNAKR
jgi:hypothetical protein